MNTKVVRPGNENMFTQVGNNWFSTNMQKEPTLQRE